MIIQRETQKKNLKPNSKGSHQKQRENFHDKEFIRRHALTHTHNHKMSKLMQNIHILAPRNLMLNTSSYVRWSRFAKLRIFHIQQQQQKQASSFNVCISKRERRGRRDIIENRERRARIHLF